MCLGGGGGGAHVTTGRKVGSLAYLSRGEALCAMCTDFLPGLQMGVGGGGHNGEGRLCVHWLRSISDSNGIISIIDIKLLLPFPTLFSIQIFVVFLKATKMKSDCISSIFGILLSATKHVGHLVKHFLATNKKKK